MPLGEMGIVAVNIVGNIEKDYLCSSLTDSW